jgi:hypothetical protein
VKAVRNFWQDSRFKGVSFAQKGMMFDVKDGSVGPSFCIWTSLGCRLENPSGFTTARYPANVNAAMKLRVSSLRYPHNRMVNKLLFHNIWWRTNRETFDVCDSSAIRSPFTPKVNASISCFQKNLKIIYIFQNLKGDLFKF